MPRRQTIELYCLCWNDARMLPFFFRHYDPIVDRYYIYDNGSTDDSLAMLERHGRVQVSHFEVRGDSFCDEERRLGDTIWQGSLADWVIVTDIDEHTYHPDLRGYLRQCSTERVTSIQSAGYEMVSTEFPAEDEVLSESVTLGMRSIGHDRLCIFNPRKITETNFGIGRHTAKPAGKVVWPEYPEVLLLHYKQLGVDYPIARSAELRQGLRSEDLTNSWGVHYTWKAKEIAKKYREMKALSGPVPGLGALRHIEPAKYFEADRIVHRSGVFDEAWYLENYLDVKEAGGAAFAHYCNHGWKEDRKPNFYFDPEWYCASYPDVAFAGRNPLCEYLETGEKENQSPSPFFDTAWYRDRYGLSADESPLRHYLKRRKRKLASPIPDFNVKAYCRRHPEVRANGLDPFEHYCKRDSGQ